MKHWPYMAIAALALLLGVVLWRGAQGTEHTKRLLLENESLLRQRIEDSLIIGAMRDSADAYAMSADTIRALRDSLKAERPTVIVRYQQVTHAIRDAHIDALQDSLAAWPKP